jgi:hypothetical protein
MRHAYSKGTEIYLVGEWAFPVFHAAADCELLYFLISFPLIMFSNYSGHDPAGVCHVESMQKDPLCPLVYLFGTGD